MKYLKSPGFTLSYNTIIENFLPFIYLHHILKTRTPLLPSAVKHNGKSACSIFRYEATFMKSEPFKALQAFLQILTIRRFGPFSTLIRWYIFWSPVNSTNEVWPFQINLMKKYGNLKKFLNSKLPQIAVVCFNSPPMHLKGWNLDILASLPYFFI